MWQLTEERQVDIAKETYAEHQVFVPSRFRSSQESLKVRGRVWEMKNAVRDDCR